jgi:hypothetical protein
LVFYQQAADEVGGNLLGGREKKDWGRRREGVVVMGMEEVKDAMNY